MLKILILLCVCIALFYLYAILPRFSEKERMEKYRHVMFAHRGYHNAEKGIPENSMKAFQAALSHGYGIELDIHLTLDGYLVVFHDDTLKRVCGCSGSVEKMTYKELKNCRLLGTDEQIPLFKDVLSLVNGQVPLLIELKIPTSSLKVCEVLYQDLQGYTGKYLVQSFNAMGLLWFRTHAPEILRGQLSSRLTKTKAKEPWILRYLTENLLFNILGRPDFISYKLTDLPKAPVDFLINVFHTPIAVWTLRTKETLKEGILHYDIQIFEKHGENY